MHLEIFTFSYFRSDFASDISMNIISSHKYTSLNVPWVSFYHNRKPTILNASLFDLLCRMSETTIKPNYKYLQAIRPVVYMYNPIWINFINSENGESPTIPGHYHLLTFKKALPCYCLTPQGNKRRQKQKLANEIAGKLLTLSTRSFH